MAASSYVAASYASLVAATYPTARCSLLPARSSTKVLSSPSLRFCPLETRRIPRLQVKAAEEQSGGVDSSELINDLKAKWDAIDNKSNVILYGGGAIVGLWLSSIVVGAINAVPLLPKLMELVGLGYTGWFVYRYLLFKSSRKELATDIEALKKKIAGTEF